MSKLTYRFLTSFILLIILYLAFLNSKILFLSLMILNFYAFFEFNEIFKKIFNKKKLFYFLSLLLSYIYIIIFSLIVWYNLNSSNEFHSTKIIFLFLICISSDVGGLLFGKLIGGKKLTKISPQKTYSGALGSILLSLLFGFYFFNNLENFLIFKINVFISIIIISLISQLGDLIISLLKRKAKMKDTGSLLPGHGGILDRIDGILLALPFGATLVLL